MSKEQLLRHEIENDILEVVDLNDEVTSSDLQGIASVTARKIIERVKKYLADKE